MLIFLLVEDVAVSTLPLNESECFVSATDYARAPPKPKPLLFCC